MRKTNDAQLNFSLSVPLLEIYTDMKDPDFMQSIIRYCTTEGAFSKLKTEENITYYLYFHKMASPFIDYFREKEETADTKLEELLKLKYHIFCDRNSCHMDESSIAKEVVKKMACEGMGFDCRFSVIFSDELPTQSLQKEIIVYQKMIEYGSRSSGRLDVYIKAHIAKSIVLQSKLIENGDTEDFLKALSTMESDLNLILQTGEYEKFTDARYNFAVEVFTNPNEKNKWPSLIKEYKKNLALFQNINDQTSIKLYERLFIQLLGHLEKEVRNEAVILLNMLYDETTWQEKTSFQIPTTKVKSVSEDFNFELTFRKKDCVEYSVILITNSPASEMEVRKNIFTCFRPESTTPLGEKFIKLSFSLGSFAKCGYYDWHVVRFKDGRFSTMKYVPDQKVEDEVKDAKGRFIVVEKSIKDLSMHEVFCDLIKAEIDKDKGRINKRGTFKTLEDKMEEFNMRYVNCLYIMGALERDNEIAYEEDTSEVIDMANPDASPLAVTCRATISKLLGGDHAFASLMEHAKKFSMKIILDSLIRVSSSRFHRKYKDVLLHFLDEKGRVQICYGSDGHSVNYEDSAVLNYRKVESWDLLISDILLLATKYKIDGVHLDNCQAWPQIMEIDTDEMSRVDPDGKPAHSPMEILNGDIVIRNAESGYWSSDLCDQYPNPFLIKLTKEVWKHFPFFLFFGECWGNDKFQNRQISLTRCGIIPRMYSLPIIISQVFGRRIHRNGYMETTKPANVSIFRDWLTNIYQPLPEGSILVQSSSGQVWPYPALLYGRGNWSAVDLLFSLPDVPMTFMDEIEGEAYRVQIVNVYELKELPRTEKSTHTLRSKSFMKLLESSKEKNNQMTVTTSSNSSNSLDEIKLPTYKLTNQISALITLSGLSLRDAKDIKAKQEMVVKEVGPEFGFDLNKIKYHYDHRRKLRSTHESLRRGSLIYLSALDNNNEQHPGVFAFARHCPEETGIFAVNITNQTTSFYLDLKSLLTIFELEINFNSICYIEDWLTEERGDFYFLREIVSEGCTRSLNPYSSLCFGFQLIQFTNDNYRRTMEKSISRMISEITGKYDSDLDFFQISNQLKHILDKNLPLEEFGKWLSNITELLGKYNISFFDYIKRLNFLRSNEDNNTKFFKYAAKLNKLSDSLLNLTHLQKLPYYADLIVKHNQLGPICFVTPELGRWSTVGGLGVMVDELTQGLVQIGQDVMVISPYYDRNRKGETGYLSRDSVAFNYNRNIDVTLDQKFTFGVHYGVCNGVKLYFLHNFNAFPSPYSEGSVSQIVRQVGLMGKASLELLCSLGIVPALIVTNDWFTGFTAGYAKAGHFGDTFRGTTFFHICHNLEATYEGRLYPSPQEGSLDHIHQLPSHWVMDPYWKQKVINPSRCAIMTCDQWGTVSQSYKKDLMESSPLAPLLNNHRRPFGFPNGIFKAQRIKALKEKAGSDKLAAKKQIQKKYFGYEDADYTVPIFSFVGRITQQKGVLLILEAVEPLIHKTGGKINILVGGMGNNKDPYCITCINKINYLRSRYAYNFWANPYEFFTDGPLVNLGSDFGLMPSLFEPGGIVQHEFFIAGTPVIAYRTGGLKDTVFEYEWLSGKGNGITFDNHNFYEFVSSVERAITLFKNKDKYENCKLNAYNSAIDVIDVSKAWCREFCRLRDKVFYNAKEVNDSIERQDTDETELIVKQLSEYDPSSYIFHNDKVFIDTFISQVEETEPPKKTKTLKIFNPGATSVIIDSETRIPITFIYASDDNKKPSSVQICGSYDKWQVRHPLAYDPLKSKWSVTLKIKKGTYYYKYIVDGEWVISKQEKCAKEPNGILSNIITI